MNFILSLSLLKNNNPQNGKRYNLGIEIKGSYSMACIISL